MIGESPTLVHYLRFDTRVLAEFDGPVGKSPRKPQPPRLLLVIVEFGFQLLADPPAIASGGDIFWIVNSQMILQRFFQISVNLFEITIG